MNKEAKIFRDLPLDSRVKTLVCYSAVYGDITSTDSIALRMRDHAPEEIERVLETLFEEGRIVLRGGYVSLPCLEDIIPRKNSNQIKSEAIIGKRSRAIKLLGKLPVIKHIGVSGSLAAGNGTPDRNDIIDVDLFVITKRHCFWLFYIPLAIYKNIWKKKRGYSLCINYIIDETDLTIYNANIYTAHELFFLLPVKGKKGYSRFVEHNLWINNFFPGFAETTSPSRQRDASVGTINKIFYLAYNLVRSVKHFSIKPLSDSSLRLDPYRSINPNRATSHYGGYQTLVMKKFCNIAEKHFPEILTQDIITAMFPDELSRAILSGEIDAREQLMEEGFGVPDIKKYG